MKKAQLIVGLILANLFCAYFELRFFQTHEPIQSILLFHGFISGCFLVLFGLNFFILARRTSTLIGLVLINMLIFFAELAGHNSSLLPHIIFTALAIGVFRGAYWLQRYTKWAIPAFAVFAPLLLFATTYWSMPENFKVASVWADLLFAMMVLYAVLAAGNEGLEVTSKKRNFVFVAIGLLATGVAVLLL